MPGETIKKNVCVNPSRRPNVQLHGIREPLDEALRHTFYVHYVQQSGLESVVQFKVN